MRVNNKVLFLAIVFVVLLSFFVYQKYAVSSQQKNKSYIVKPSPIQGVGIYTMKNVKKNQVLFKAVNDNRSITKRGSFINHCSSRANTKLVEKNNGWYIVALTAIKADTELLCDYNHTPNFINKPKADWTC